MSGELRFAAPQFDMLRSALLADTEIESCALGFAARDPAGGAWIVKEASPAPESAYEHRDAVSAVLRPSFLVDAANRARTSGDCIVLMHTHPKARGIPSFSEVDDRGEAAIGEFLRRRAPGVVHLAMVIGPDGHRARRLDDGRQVPAWIVGERLAGCLDPADELPPGGTHDRQVRAFGATGQRAVGGVRVGVVGVGGTGSVLVQQLAHLGVLDITLIDPDRVESTNLNRLAGAAPADVGLTKAAVAARMVQRISPDATVVPLERDVVDADVAAALGAVNFVFLCTDSHASRAVVNQLAYQHLVPVIDMGVSVTVRDGAVTHITGRVQMLAPGLPCLVCTDALDAQQIRREMLTPEQRAADPYLIGAHEPQPAVMSINSTVASLAVTMFLGAVTAMPAVARFQLYDGIRGTVRPTVARSVPNCLVCSPTGALAQGACRQLPVRPTQGRD